MTAGYLPAGTGQATTYTAVENEEALLGKRKRKRSNSPEKRRAEIQSRKVFGVPLTLDEKRAEEAQAVKPILKEQQPSMLHIKDWLKKNFAAKMSKENFRKLEGMFCDAILLPRLAMLFPKYKDYEIYLRSKGL